MTRKSDRKLLELAAKAAGIEHLGWVPAGLSFAHRAPWNSLADNADAFQLQCRMGFSVHVGAGGQVLVYGCYGLMASVGIVDGDAEKAARRAITEAAAYEQEQDECQDQ